MNSPAVNSMVDAKRPRFLRFSLKWLLAVVLGAALGGTIALTVTVRYPEYIFSGQFKARRQLAQEIRGYQEALDDQDPKAFEMFDPITELMKTARSIEHIRSVLGPPVATGKEARKPIETFGQLEETIPAEKWILGKAMGNSGLQAHIRIFSKRGVKLVQHSLSMKSRSSGAQFQEYAGPESQSFRGVMAGAGMVSGAFLVAAFWLLIRCFTFYKELRIFKCARAG